MGLAGCVPSGVVNLYDIEGFTSLKQRFWMGLTLTQAQFKRMLAANPGLRVNASSPRPTKVARSMALAGSAAGATPTPASVMSPPQRKLWLACIARFPEATIVSEHPAGVPGRKFRIDIAFPAHALAVEVDGWTYHGKHLAAHAKDRERQNLMVQQGWRVLRFSVKQINGNMAACLAAVAAMVSEDVCPKLDGE